MGLADLANILWREREMLELLLFKLEQEQLILANGRVRWLAHATREVELVLDEIRRTEVARAAEADAVGAKLGLGPGPTISELAEASPPPWPQLLHEHRTAFRSLTAEIAALAEANRALLTAGRRSVCERMFAVAESAPAVHRLSESHP
jgi:hypothetical protein